MRRLFDNARRELEAFIDQRDDLLLLAACAPNDLGFVLQTLRDIEQASGTDLFLLFSDNFLRPGPFLDVAAERLREEHRTACQALAEKGRDPLPPLPPALGDPSRPPAVRLIEAIGFARSLVPPDGGHRLVWAMCPLEVADWEAYLQLVAALVPAGDVRSWMRGVRLVFRYQTEMEHLAPGLAREPWVRVAAMNLGPADMEASLREDMDNEQMPVEERMQALLSLALLDYAHNRAADAKGKFNHLLGHYQQTDNKMMQAFVMNGLGDVARRQGDREKALHWYECAVPPAAEARDATVLSGIVRNLAEMNYERGRYADAEQYFDQLDQLTSVTLDASCKARALEWRGLCQEKQKALDRATQSWETSAAFCRNTWRPGLRANLEHLARVYQRQRPGDKLTAVQAELAGLKKGGDSL
jgi:tetratricopeptide (TPR) repeat protein